jgi:hypothetical protein
VLANATQIPDNVHDGLSTTIQTVDIDLLSLSAFEPPADPAKFTGGFLIEAAAHPPNKGFTLEAYT